MKSGWWKSLDPFTRGMATIAGALVLVAVIRVLWPASATEVADTATQPGIWEITRTGLSSDSRNAPVSILVFADYRCSECRLLNAEIDSLRFKFPDHLRVIWKMIDLSGDRRGLRTAMAAYCVADMGKFRSFHTNAFERADLASLPDGWSAISESAGISDPDSLRACVESDRYRQRVEDNVLEAQQIALTRTPTLFIAGVRIEGRPSLRVLDSLVVTQLRR